MDLYLVRHGIAIDREDPKCSSEAERFLTQEGVKKTIAVARGFAQLDAMPGLWLSSPYKRAYQTAEIFAEVLGFPKEQIRNSEQLLPEQMPEGLYSELTNYAAKQIICFGHAPNIDLLLAYGLGVQWPIAHLKKAGFAWLKLHSLSPPKGELRGLINPRMIRKLS